MCNIKIAGNTLEIDGNINGLNDFFQIKDTIESMNLNKANTLVFDIKNSFSMPSAMIGYLLKLIQQDKIPVILNVHDHRLMELLDDLNLKSIFNVREVEAVL